MSRIAEKNLRIGQRLANPMTKEQVIQALQKEVGTTRGKIRKLRQRDIDTQAEAEWRSYLSGLQHALALVRQLEE